MNVESYGEPIICDIEGLAKRLDVTEQTVRNWVKAKAVPFFKRKRVVRFVLQEVLAHAEVKPDKITAA